MLEAMDMQICRGSHIFLLAYYSGNYKYHIVVTLCLISNPILVYYTILLFTISYYLAFVYEMCF